MSYINIGVNLSIIPIAPLIPLLFAKTQFVMLNNMSVVIPTRITTPYLSDVDVNIPLASKVLLINDNY